jgi:hypothetical protein
MQFIETLNNNSGAINVMLTAVYVLATLVMAFFMFRANKLTRKNIDLLTILETERMRPQLYFDLVTDGQMLFAKLKNHGTTAAFDIEITLEPKVLKRPNGNEELKLASSKIAYLPPQKELEEFIDTFSQFMVYRPDLKFNGRLNYRGATKDKYYNEEVNIDLPIHKVPFISKKVMTDELANVAYKLDELVRVMNDQRV